MSQTLIEQRPLKRIFPVEQDVIFTVSNNSIVTTFTRVKFVAQVFISSDLPPNTSVATNLVGTFKTTPNNAGVGMFDFRPVLESFVKVDNLARKGSSYKTASITTDSELPIHLIDKFSGNQHTIRYLAIKFKVEYEDALGNLVTDFEVDSNLFQFFNGYLKYTDQLLLQGNNFGFDLDNSFKLDGATKKFLSNAPTTQYANLEDYGTVGLLMNNPFSSSNITGFDVLEIDYYSSAGVYLGAEFIFPNSASGGFLYPESDIQAQLLYVGLFPANLQGWSSIFQALVSAGTIQGGYYTIIALDGNSAAISEEYTIELNCPTLKGFEPIRLTWLNQWGTWDYYTFNMKSTKSIKTKGSTYQQLEGSWNEATYRLDRFKGGKKSFRVNATEKITMNTDFVNESESAWFEELINSPEVYILEGFKTDVTNSALNKYVTPVRLTTSSYTKKTIANDKIMQYTFEVEKTKTLRTQSI
tara:strand:+ start:1541 stop:2950 length:1410 start_codon:yes stop_codon:yes gene_type:complete